ncbi:MAG: hypothetical protein K6F37_02195 [Lachnospiraceae bacterium]|nr:hypothetical protein [Lachnospiraceae bacterium]
MNDLVILLSIALALLVVFRKNIYIVNACLVVMGLTLIVKGGTIIGASMWKNIAVALIVCGILMICIATFRCALYYFRKRNKIE